MTKITEDIELELKEFLDGYSKLLILGIGNDIRGDDGLGPYIINRLFDLKEDILDGYDFLLEHASVDGDNGVNLSSLDFKDIFNNISLIDGGSVPENFTGPIKKFNPSHLLIIDASLMNMGPGAISVVSKENIVNLSVSTHSMSLNYLIKYLEKGMGDELNILFIGIQPESMDLSMDLSDLVKDTCDELIKTLLKIIVECNQ